MKKTLAAIAVLIAALAATALLGPREPVEENIAEISLPKLTQLDTWLAERESKVANLRDGSAKTIVWANPVIKFRTEYAVVYIHGFSANREEVRPLPDIVAKQLGANLHFARLTGHGRDGAAMAQTSANAWLNDVAEALAVGRALGDKVLVLSASTGGTLATWALSKPELAEGVVGSVKISPNYAVQAEGAEVLTWPWARHIVPLVFGEERSFEPINDGHARHWTTSYPNVALLPMQATVKRASEVAVEELETPTLFIVHPDDKVVRSDVTKQVAERWGGPAELVEIETSDDPFNHVIAGNILSPSTTQSMAERVIAWAKKL